MDIQTYILKRLNLLPNINIATHYSYSYEKSSNFHIFDNDKDIRVHSYPDKNRECYHPKLEEFGDKIKITGVDEDRSLKREHYLLKKIDDTKSELETFKQSLELARRESF